MPLKLMYITNRPEIARIAEESGVDRIFVDMEYIGKSIRQGGMDTVQSHHTTKDIAAIKKAITTAELLVRCNPIHDESDEYTSSAEEIDAIIKNGADIIMLPYFKSPDEVREFIRLVCGRVKTMLLVETPEAVECIEEILAVPGIDEVHIGLNDLSLGYGKKFMFELLVDGTVETLCLKCRHMDIPYGFGGIAALGKGALPAEYVIREHYRLGSSCAILSRSFCNTNIIDNIDNVRDIFVSGMKDIRAFEKECEEHISYFNESRKELLLIVKEISVKQL